MEIHLPFNPKLQSAFLGHCISNDKFFIQIKDKVEPNWFDSTGHAKVYKMLLEFWEEFHRHPRGRVPGDA